MTILPIVQNFDSFKEVLKDSPYYPDEKTRSEVERILQEKKKSREFAIWVLKNSPSAIDDALKENEIMRLKCSAVLCDNWHYILENWSIEKIIKLLKSDDERLDELQTNEPISNAYLWSQKKLA